MSYYITTQGYHNLTLFLIDRSKSKKHWWTINLYNAMAFNKKSAANYSANRLKYKNPCVIDLKDAEKLERENDLICMTLEEHPFSSEALGQD